MGGLALLQSLSDLFASGGKAKQEMSEEAMAKQQLYSQLETAALQRKRLEQEIRLAEHPPNLLEQQIADMEKAMKRPLTDIEKERALGVAPKDLLPKVATKLVQDKNSSTGWSFISYDPISGVEYSRQLDAPPQRGLIESETETTDPLTGLTTVSHRKPIIGQPGAKPITKPLPVAKPARSAMDLNLTPTAPLPLRPGQRRSPAGPLAARPAGATPTTPSLPPLDASGHIPPLRNAPGVTPYVVETANELLDGKDMDKVKYPKLVPVASKLARAYGWEQGKFTPKEQVMLRETTNFIQRAMHDNSMKALDEDLLSRLKMSQLIQNPDRESIIGRGAQTLIARGMTPSQVLFIQTYNQLVGVISGLSQLVRSGRATEATIERLKAELPNPNTTKDSKDAQQRLQRLTDEINLALRKGTFTEGEVDPAQQFLDNFRKKQGGAGAPR